MGEPGAWWCTAYGPPPPDADPDTWPLCFFTPTGRVCGTESVCTAEMALERQRVHSRISSLAVFGDETAAYLLTELPDPGMLLGGPLAEQGDEQGQGERLGGDDSDDDESDGPE